MKRFLAVVGLVALVSSGAPASASHPNWMCLDIDPDQHSATSNDDIVDTLRAYPGTNDAGHPPEHEGCVTERVEPSGEWDFGGTNIDFEITGAGDPDSSDTPATPDLTCTVSEGFGSCWVTPPSAESGSQTIRAWIDADQTSTEMDQAEGYDETTAPGDYGEPDITDVAQWNWGAMDTTSESEVTIDYARRRDALRGRVTSTYPPCEIGRTVKVFKRVDGGKRLIGTAETNSGASGTHGRWRLDMGQNTKGRFYAVATAATRHTASPGTDVTCLRARSSALASIRSGVSPAPGTWCGSLPPLRSASQPRLR